MPPKSGKGGEKRRRKDDEGREGTPQAIGRRSFVLICALFLGGGFSDINQEGSVLLHPANRPVRRPPPPLPSPSRPTILLLLPTIRQFNAFRQF